MNWRWTLAGVFGFAAMVSMIAMVIHIFLGTAAIVILIYGIVSVVLVVAIEILTTWDDDRYS